MGLDAFELVVKIEETFGIKIPNDKSPLLTTVGELYDYILAQSSLPRAGTCLTATTFGMLKTGVESLGLSARFAPSTKLAEILPNKNRRQFWSQLSEQTGLRLPELVRPSWMVKVNAAITILASVLVAYVTTKGHDAQAWFPLIGIVCLFVFGYLTAWLTLPWADQFDQSVNSFRGLSERVFALNRSAIKNKDDMMGRTDIWVVLREIIVDTLGVDYGEVVRDASFVRDLGCE